MNVIVAGGRDYQPTKDDLIWLLEQFVALNANWVTTGGALGADEFGHSLAKSFGLKTRVIHADWEKWGRAAGPIRNAKMAEVSDAVILFPGGRGTASMRWEARKRGLKIIERKVSV